jgi:ABC-type lipoprotein export system ATPase subunit
VKAYRAPSGAAIQILAGVDLTVAAGELVLIVGPSGCGKSTLLNVVGLLEDADAGVIEFGGERVSALPRARKSRARGRFVGFVFQSFLLLPSLTALENVALAARYVSGDAGDARRRALDLLADLGVADRRDGRCARPSPTTPATCPRSSARRGQAKPPPTNSGPTSWAIRPWYSAPTAGTW